MYSAGILPYTIIDSKVYIMLGRESYDQSYSDFGGKYDRSDETVMDTAYREFVEESLYTKMEMSEFSNLNAVYTESRTLKGHIYYMFLVYMDMSRIVDVFKMFNEKWVTYAITKQNQHTQKTHLSKEGYSNKGMLFEKDRLILVSLNDALHGKLKDPADKRLLKSDYTLRTVFKSTINMHRCFLETFDTIAMNLPHNNVSLTDDFIRRINIMGYIDHTFKFDDSFNGLKSDANVDVDGWVVAKGRRRKKYNAS